MSNVLRVFNDDGARRAAPRRAAPRHVTCVCALRSRSRAHAAHRTQPFGTRFFDTSPSLSSTPLTSLTSHVRSTPTCNSAAPSAPSRRCSPLRERKSGSRSRARRWRAPSSGLARRTTATGSARSWWRRACNRGVFSAAIPTPAPPPRNRSIGSTSVKPPSPPTRARCVDNSERRGRARAAAAAAAQQPWPLGPNRSVSSSSNPCSHGPSRFARPYT